MTKTRTEPSDATDPPRLRLKLTTATEVSREMARLYREGKAGCRDVADVSRLSNVLAMLARCLETSDQENRIARLENDREEKYGKKF